MRILGYLFEVVGFAVVVWYGVQWLRVRPKWVMTTLRKLPIDQRRQVFSELQLRNPPNPDLVSEVRPFAERAVSEPLWREIVYGGLTFILLGEALIQNKTEYWIIVAVYVVLMVLTIMGQKRFRTRSQAYLDATQGLS